MAIASSASTKMFCIILLSTTIGKKNNNRCQKYLGLKKIIQQGLVIINTLAWYFNCWRGKVDDETWQNSGSGYTKLWWLKTLIIYLDNSFLAWVCTSQSWLQAGTLQKLTSKLLVSWSQFSACLYDLFLTSLLSHEHQPKLAPCHI